MSGFIGSGTLYFDRQDASGASTGLIPIGNATVLSITPKAEIKERKSLQRETYGQVLDSVPLNQPASLAMTIDDVDADNLAMALLGDVAAFSQAAQAAKTVDIEVQPGKWQELGYVQLTNVASITDGGTPLALSDYDVNLPLGMVRVHAGVAGVAAGDTLTVTLNAPAVTGKRIAGAVRPTIKTRLVLDGLNVNTGQSVRVDIYEATITPGKAIDFIGQDFASIEFSGTLNTPSGKSSPFEVLVLGS